MRGASTGEDGEFLGEGQLFPTARRKIAQFERADTYADQPKGGMPHGGGHAADLAVAAFDEFEGDP